MGSTPYAINAKNMAWTVSYLESNSTRDPLFYSPGNTTNATRNSTVPAIPAYILITTTFFYVGIFLLGIIGNTLIVYVVLRSRTMHSSTHLFLVNLSLSDLLVLVICMPTALVDLYAKEVWYLGEGMCKLVPFLENCTALTSTITIVMISCERYRGICQPMKTRTTQILRRYQVGILMAVSWVVAMLSCIPFLFIPIYKDSQFKDGTPIKVCRNTIQSPWQIGYILFVLCFFFIIPFLALFVMYVIIAKNLTTDSTLHGCPNILAAKRRLRKRRQVMVMLSMVVFSFFTFHLPIRTISIWFVYATEESMIALGLEGYYNLLTFARVMFYLHCATNPIIYNAMSTKFRLATVKEFCDKKNKKAGHPLFTKQFTGSLSSRQSNQTNGQSNIKSSTVETISLNQDTSNT